MALPLVTNAVGGMGGAGGVGGSAEQRRLSAQIGQQSRNLDKGKITDDIYRVCYKHLKSLL